jgi:hypothetical protein
MKHYLKRTCRVREAHPSESCNQQTLLQFLPLRCVERTLQKLRGTAYVVILGWQQ